MRLIFKQCADIVILASLCICLLYDSAFLFRITLLCAAIHEVAHIFVYVMLKHKLPQITLNINALELNKIECLSKREDILVTLAGPVANFITAFIAWICSCIHASYNLSFVTSVSICIGVYNLLPIGILDGARLLSDFISNEKISTFYNIQKILIIVICIAAIIFVTVIPCESHIKVIIILSCGYIFYSYILM